MKKHQKAIDYLKERLLPLEDDNIPDGPNKAAAKARRDEVCKELRDAIVALGGDNPDDGDSGGGPGEERPNGL